MKDLLDKLAARLGPQGLCKDEQIIAPHLHEWRNYVTGATPFMMTPATTEEVAFAVRACADAGVPITPQGGNTGLVGAQTPVGEALLSLKRMNAIRTVDPIDDAITAEAGVILANVHEAAEKADRLFPLSLASQGSATIGGLISTNAGGVHVVRYGMMRDLVLGLEIVLPNGDILHGLKSLRKDNTGYDLKQLFIGAEGTLGVVTAATLKLFPRPSAHFVAMCAVNEPDHALALLHAMKARTGALAAFEIMNRESVDMTVRNVPGRRDPFPTSPYLALIEFESLDADGLQARVEDALSEACASGLAQDVLIAQSEREAKEFWALREDISVGHRPEGVQLSNDISVPVSKVPTFLSVSEKAVRAILPDARIVAFGHAGDGNLHYTVLHARGADPATFPREPLSFAVHDAAVKLGGSISAEHGIGVMRLDDFRRFKDPLARTVMRAVKDALDPHNLMNPRALLAGDSR